MRRETHLQDMVSKWLATVVLLSVSIIGGFLASCATGPTSVSGSAGSLESPVEPELAFLGSDTCLECHDDGLDNILDSRHWFALDPRTPGADENGCEACHGPGEKHFEMDGDINVPGFVTFGKNANVPAEKQNEMCLNCHQSDAVHWPGSAHDNDDISCTSCHKLLHRDRAVSELREQSLCYNCHQNVRAETLRSFRHPIREELVQCTDCHDPHGAPGPSLLRQLSINDNCFTCHAEKRGPHLWEHEPVVDNCDSCHLPHGSLHPALLSSRPPLLCQQCHQSSRITHVRQGFYFGKPPVPRIDQSGGIGHGAGAGPVGGGEFGRDQGAGNAGNNGNGSGSGSGSSSGNGPGDETGGGSGNGPGDGTGSGSGPGDGTGSGSGPGDGSGNGPGDGTGGGKNASGSASGNGSGGGVVSAATANPANRIQQTADIPDLHAVQDREHEGDHSDDQGSNGDKDQDKDQNKDQNKDQDKKQDQDKDKEHKQDRLQEGPGSDNVVEGGSARFLLGNSCLGCHSQVHGSNHPSGFRLMR